MQSLSYRQPKSIAKILVALWLGLFLLGLAPRLASAHAQFVRSNPAPNSSLESGKPPAQMQVWFSERIEANFSKLEILNKQGQQVDRGDSHTLDPFSLVVSLPTNLPDSIYTVVYTNVSEEDGHAVKGSFAFVVGVETLPPPPGLLDGALASSDPNFDLWSVAVRWLNYLAMTGLVGGLVFLLLVWRPSLKQVKVRVGPELNEANLNLLAQSHRILGWTIGLLGLGWLAFLIFQAGVAGNVYPWQLLSTNTLPTLLFNSRLGLIWLVRLTLIIIAAVLLFVPKRTTNLRLGLLLLVSCAIMLTTTLNSHAAASENALILIPADLAHMVSAGFWVGGLASLVLVLPTGLKALMPGSGDRTRLLAALIPNFSFVAILSVAVLLTSGSLQAAFQLGSVDAFFNGNYGKSLLVKIILLIPLLGLGAYHLLVVSPKMRQFTRRKGGEDKAGSAEAGALQRTFRRTVIIEFGISVVLLVAVGSLTSFSPPAKTALPGSLISLHQGQVSGLKYTLAISPERVGDNIFELELKDANNQPVVNPNQVLLRVNHLTMEMGVQELELKPVVGKPGRYTATGSLLSMTGDWQIELILRRPGLDDLSWQVKIGVQS